MRGLPFRQLWPWILGLVILGVGSKGIRPYVRGDDFGLTGVMPNFATVSFFCFLVALWRLPSWAIQVGFAIGLIGYEIEQAFSGDVKRTFDVWDVAATIVGLVASHYVLGWLAARHARSKPA